MEGYQRLDAYSLKNLEQLTSKMVYILICKTSITHVHVTIAKFNCTVPGTTPSSNTTECPQTVLNTPISNTHHEPTTTLFLTVSTMATKEPMKANNPSLFEVGSPLFYGVVGTGGVAIVVLFSLIGTGMVLVCSKERKGE